MSRKWGSTIWVVCDQYNDHKGTREKGPQGHRATLLCTILDICGDIVAILFVYDMDIIHLNMEANKSLAKAHCAL